MCLFLPVPRVLTVYAGNPKKHSHKIAEVPRFLQRSKIPKNPARNLESKITPKTPTTKSCASPFRPVK